MLLSGGGSALLPSTQGNTSTRVAVILLSLILVGTGWLIRLLYYRVSMHNAAYYQQMVAYEQQQWWAQHRQSFALQEVVLLGPAGMRSDDWLRVLRREQRQPVEKRAGRQGTAPAAYLRHRRYRA